MREQAPISTVAPTVPAELAETSITVLTILPDGGGGLTELWEFRELMFFLAWRDVKVRYKQTVLGVAWAIIQPFFTMVVFSVFFGRLAKMGSEGLPYPIFAYTALVPWSLFATSLSESSSSLVSNSNLIKKVYFPKLVVPISTVISSLLDFAIAFALLIAMMLYFGVTPSIRLMCVPLFVLLAITTSLGVGLWFSALNVQFRDIRYAIPFLVQVWLFGTPVAYSSTIVPDEWRWLYALNPMVGVVEGFRWALLGTEGLSPSALATSVGAAILLAVTGALFFRRMERGFADII